MWFRLQIIFHPNSFKLKSNSYIDTPYFKKKINKFAGRCGFFHLLLFEAMNLNFQKELFRRWKTLLLTFIKLEKMLNTNKFAFFFWWFFLFKNYSKTCSSETFLFSAWKNYVCNFSS